jgi:hypothetical protein
MKKLVLIAFILGFGVLVWVRQRPQLQRLEVQNRRLAAAAAELKARADRAEAARQSAEQRLADLSHDSELHPVPAAAAPGADSSLQPRPLPPPDQAHQGGWPPDAAFFYFPKQYLTNVSYRLLDGERLTDEAAAIFGMSAAERDAVDQAFGELVDQFHRVEIQHMQLVAPPAGWPNPTDPAATRAMSFDSVLTYRIADLSDDLDAARKAFGDQLEQAVGAARAQLLTPAAESYLRQDLDDLGAGDRIVGFVWERERDGSYSLWYGRADARHGQGFFERVPDNLDPHSQTAYYARLFGVRLPGQ